MLLLEREKIRIGILEVHVTHACNLTCESCGHYSNQNHKGMISVEVADTWMKRWNKFLLPDYISVLGGEPTIHKNLPEWIEMTRSNWSNAIIRITSNGFFLKNHPRLPEVLQKTGTELKISIHHNSPEYDAKKNEILALIDDWKKQFDFKLIIAESNTVWFRQYHSFGSQMMPFQDNNPEASWLICKWKGCWQLHEGKIWKCAPVAYLKMQKEKHGLDPIWDQYLEYKPLDSKANYKQMKEFFAKGYESVCAMCPATVEYFEPKSPLIPVGDLFKRL